MFNPINPRWLVTANSEKGIALWDCRKPKEVFVHYDQDAGETSGISACFNSDGSRILGLRRRLPPVLYATEKSSAICQFYHPQYYNSCTMKTCCFAGENDEYILSGSDDFNLYMWKIPREGSEWGISHIVLKDHRSIVNQVRYNKHSNLIASSGVEKMIKLWSTVPVGSWRGSLLKDHSAKARLVYSHDDYISLVGQSGERISHDYSDQSTMEDAKMMAFFDSLIQREIEGWDSSSENVMSSDSDCDQEQLLSVLTSSMFSTSKLPSEDLKRHRPNRIAQLIAQKRKKLIKMAHDKSTLLRHKLKEKQHRKKKGVHKHKSSSSSSKSGPSKNAGPSSKKSTVSKSPPPVESRESRAKHKAVADRSRLRKYRTRQSLKDLSDSAASSNSLDAPSTSTGITSSSSSIFRIIEQDSDEDILPNSGNCVVEDNNNSSEPENFVSILPTPLNGTHDMYINVLEMNSDLNNGGNVVTVRNDDVSNYERASTSNGGLHVINGGSSSGSSGGAGNVFEDSSCGTNGFVQTLNTFDNNVKDDNDDDDDNTDSDSDDSDDYGWEYVTPVKKRRTISASDSGCWTGPSSMSPYLTRASKNHQACSSGSGLNDNGSNGIEYEKFKKRVKKAKVNMRKQFGLDSDSN